MSKAEIRRTDIESAINEWIVGRKAYRNRMILRDRLCDGYTYEHLAEIYGLSVRQVKNIVYKGEDILFRHI